MPSPLASVGGIVWMAMSYNRGVGVKAPVTSSGISGPGVRHSGIIVIADRILSDRRDGFAHTQSDLGRYGCSSRSSEATGILRVTRHPFLWGALRCGRRFTFSCQRRCSVGGVLRNVSGACRRRNVTRSMRKRARKMADGWIELRGANFECAVRAAILGGSQLAHIWASCLTYRQLIALAVVPWPCLFGHAWLFSAHRHFRAGGCRSKQNFANRALTDLVGSLCSLNLRVPAEGECAT